MTDDKLFLCRTDEYGAVDPETCKTIWVIDEEGIDELLEAQDSIEDIVDGIMLRGSHYKQ